MPDFTPGDKIFWYTWEGFGGDNRKKITLINHNVAKW
jgi:hypothetical protein